MNRFRLSPAMQLALIFLMFGLGWVLVTDFLLMRIAEDNIAFLMRFQTYKGFLYISISALLIYFVGKAMFARQKMLQDKLADERTHYRNELALEVFNAQEGERKKLGEELHDNINQLLGVVKLYIEHAQVNPAAKDEMLKKSSEYLLQVINEIRGLSKSLISPTLKDIGLLASVYDLIESIQQTKMIEIDLVADTFDENQLTDVKKLLIYRILQEQLNNILKHSKAEHVTIEIAQRAGSVCVKVEDDGMGFDVNHVRPGLGLKNIRHRLEMFRGEMNVVSAPGNGCIIEAKFEA